MKEEKEEAYPLFPPPPPPPPLPPPSLQISSSEPVLTVLPNNLLLQLVPVKLTRSSAIRDYPDGCVRRGSSITALVVHKENPDDGIKNKPDQSVRKSDRHGQNAIHTSPQSNQILPFASPSSTRKVKQKRLFDPLASTLTNLHIAKTTRNLGPPTAAQDLVIYDARSVVISTLRIYDAVRRSLLLNEDYKITRPDLYAGTTLMRCGLWINRNTTRIVGEFPGVEVGDIFFFRMELCCIGMHGPVQGGIAYLQPKESIYDTVVAISIISSGGYSAEDCGDILIYTGQGGRQGPDGKQAADQKLERGNLAMECSYKNNVPVRVIRGIKDPNSPSGKTYTYDGLYWIENAWAEKTRSGFKEFKFKLNRFPGQPELGSAMIKLSNELRNLPHLREGLRFHDISAGKEALPVCVVNTVDDDEGPEPFHYTTSMHNVHSGSMKNCLCLRKYGNKAPYLSNGFLVKERAIIHECGGSCQCSINCMNRLTQRPSRFRFEVFKSEEKGWGLRSQDVIPSGSFVCEYVGRIVDDKHPLKSQNYYLDLGMIEEKGAPKWGDVSGIIGDKQNLVASDEDHELRIDFTLDSTEIGNMARFINHSWTPNLLVQRVIWDHHQTNWLPHVMLFAMDNIPPFRELTLNYGSSHYHYYHS